MNSSAEHSAENKKPAQYDLTAEYKGGSVDYTVIEGYSENNPALIIPGFTEGRFVLDSFAQSLNNQGDRTVIFPDQPQIDKRKTKLSIIDQHAEALLAIVEKEGLGQIPLDIITHSFGSLVAVRAAELAKDKGVTSFDHNEGSNAIFITPAGSNDKENLLFLGGRWVIFLKNGMAYGKELDPTGEMMKAGVKNFNKNLSKTIKETIALGKKSTIYENLGEVGLRPFVFGYASDDMYPHKVIKSIIKEGGEALDGYGVPIDTGGVGAGTFEEFKEKTGLAGKNAKKAWAHHYRNAGHNDLLFHPERTVKAILQVIDR